MITIPWEEGGDNNIYLDFTNPLEPIITSDENPGQTTRTKILKFKSITESPNQNAYLTIEQNFQGLVVVVFNQTLPVGNNTVPGFQN